MNSPNLDFLFRGKTKNLKVAEWIVGSLVQGIRLYDGKPASFIYDLKTKIDGRGVTEDRYGEEVIPDTIGQYIGATDKNGKPIFRGDIVRYSAPGFREKEYYEVKYGYGQFYVGINCPIGGYRASICEVVGNIWDNPELLN